MAQCCYPIPGDKIVGRVTQSHGISIHRADCPNIDGSNIEKQVGVSWGSPKETRYTARLKIEGIDKPNLVSDIVEGITTMQAFLKDIRATVINNSRTRVVAEVQVKDIEHLYKIVARLNTISGVIEIIRG